MGVSGFKRRVEARSLASKARALCNGVADLQTSEALRSLANAIDLLAEDCEQLEATGNARVRE